MNARRVEITLPQKLWERLEERRGHEPRAAFIKRALESALGSAGDADSSGTLGIPAPDSASSRAPKSVGTDNPASRSIESAGGRLESGLARASRPSKTRAELALERQAKLNKAKS